MYLTEVIGIDKLIITHGLYYSGTSLLPQEYLFHTIGPDSFRNYFADWAAHNAGKDEFF